MSISALKVPITAWAPLREVVLWYRSGVKPWENVSRKLSCRASTPVVFVLPELPAAILALPRCGVLVHVALQAAVGTETATADQAMERSIFSGHGFLPLPPGRVFAPHLADC